MPKGSQSCTIGLNFEPRGFSILNYTFTFLYLTITGLVHHLVPPPFSPLTQRHMHTLPLHHTPSAGPAQLPPHSSQGWICPTPAQLAGRREEVTANADKWVQQALSPAQLQQGRMQGAAWDGTYTHRGTHPEFTIDTRVAGGNLTEDFSTKGLLIMELCGGLGAGLEAALALGAPVHAFIYADTVSR